MIRLLRLGWIPIMATELKPIQGFRLTRILNDDPLAHALTLLGDVPSNAGTERSQAILRIEKTALSSDTGDSLSAGTLLNRLELEGHTDIVSSRTHSCFERAESRL